MASPVVSAMSTWVTEWESATPPDRTSVTYAEVDAHDPLTGSSGDRTFFFLDPERLDPISFKGADHTEVEWQIRATLRLNKYGRSLSSMRAAIANEGNLLMRALEISTSWPSTVISFHSEGVVSERDEETGDALLTFTTRFLCVETD